MLQHLLKERVVAIPEHRHYVSGTMPSVVIQIEHAREVIELAENVQRDQRPTALETC
jgi:hypothetical protein